MRDELDTAGAAHDRTGEGRHQGTPRAGLAGEEPTTEPKDPADWRTILAVRAVAIRRSVAAMPPTRPLPPR